MISLQACKTCLNHGCFCMSCLGAESVLGAAAEQVQPGEPEEGAEEGEHAAQGRLEETAGTAEEEHPRAAPTA